MGSVIEKKGELQSKALSLEQQKEQEKKRQEELAVKLKEMKAAFLRGNKLK